MSDLDKLAKMLAAAMDNKSTETTQYAAYHVQVSGDTVSIAGRTYFYIVVVDVPISDGDWVWAILNQAKTKAVIIGV